MTMYPPHTFRIPLPENKAIGIDIDDTLAQTSHQVCQHAQNNMGFPVVYEQISDFFWYNVPEFSLSKEQAYEIWNTFWSSSYAQIIPPMPNSQEALSKLR